MPPLSASDDIVDPVDQISVTRQQEIEALQLTNDKLNNYERQLILLVKDATAENAAAKKENGMLKTALALLVAGLTARLRVL